MAKKYTNKNSRDNNRQGLFQDFAQERANTLWQISGGGNNIKYGKAN